MRFEVMVQYGNRWSYKGIFTATDCRLAARQAQRSTRRNVVKVRPEDSRDKWLVYRFKAV